MIDDATAAYVLTVRRPFDDLRSVASQLAGLLVLAASGASTASPDHPMLAAAASACDEAADAVRHIVPPAHATPHHHALVNASDALMFALSDLRRRLGARGEVEIDSTIVALRRGYAHLQAAANLLPGFELVALSRGCCGRCL